MSYFIISAPSGTGKTTLIRALLQSNPNFRLSISTTTRPKRSLEEHGKDYYFITKEQFEEHLKNDDFLEHAKVFHNYYGTLKSEMERLRNFNIIFDVDVYGMRQIKAALPSVITIFIVPPSFEELENRLIKRNQDTIEVIHHRLLQAKREMSCKNEYDHVIVNDDIENALKQIQNYF